MEAHELFTSVIEVATSIREDLVFTDFSKELLMECCERTLAANPELPLPQMQIAALTSFNNLIPVTHNHISGMLELCDAIAISYRGKTFTFTHTSGF